MLNKVQAIYEANRTLSNEELAKQLQSITGLRISECREWIKAWVLAWSLAHRALGPRGW